jgi:capsular exopolysaccharide synthesis family protein
MSELFKWLSKTEAKRPGHPSAHVFDPDFRPRTSFDSDLPLETAHDREALPSRAEFNLELADKKLKAVLDAKTHPGEQLRFLRTRLSQLQRQHGFKKLLITSSIPGEGKTFIACCLAGILAQEPGKRVLLMDADLRRPRTALNLGLEKETELVGLSNILQRTHALEESLLKASGMDLFFLPSGRVPDNPSELLASENLERIIQEASVLFDWIIVDSPPVLNIADSTRLAPLCDTVVLVVHANKTPAKLIQKTIQMVGKSAICGIVMNRAKIHSTSRYYYKYYSSKNGRGAK